MEEELLQVEFKALRWEPYVRYAAFWVLVFLCVSPLIASIALLFGLSASEQLSTALFDAYRFHLRMNFGLGVAAFAVLIAWAANRLSLFGTSALGELSGQKWAIPLLLLVLWVSVSTAINCTSVARVIIGDESRLEGILSLLCYAGFALCALLIDDARRRRALMLAFCAVSSVIGVMYLVQTAGIGALGTLNGTGFCVIFGNINHHAYYVALGILAAAGIFVYEESAVLKVASALTVAFLSVCLIINSSFGPFLAAAFALVFLVIISLINGGKGKLIALIPLALFLCVSFGNVTGIDYQTILSGPSQRSATQEESSVHESGPASETGASSTTSSNFTTLIQDIQKILSGSADAASAGSFRMALYIASADLIAESPVLGYGMEKGGPLLYDRAGVDIDRAHNEILQWGIYGGVPAMLLYVAGLAMLAVRQLRRLRQLDATAVIGVGCAAAYLCSSLFGCVMISVTPYFWMFVGLAAWLPAAIDRPTEEGNE